MFATILLGAIGCTLGPLGAVALGGLGAAIDATSDYDAEYKPAESVCTGEEDELPVWNARYGRWDDALKVQPSSTVNQHSDDKTSPTRATTSRWVDPVDPEFQV